MSIKGARMHLFSMVEKRRKGGIRRKTSIEEKEEKHLFTKSCSLLLFPALFLSITEPVW
jgi:hypothetical protein